MKNPVGYKIHAYLGSMTSRLYFQLIELQLYNSADTNWLRYHDLPEAISAIQLCQMTCFKKYDFKQKFVFI